MKEEDLIESALPQFNPKGDFRVPRNTASKYSWGYSLNATRLLMAIIHHIDMTTDDDEQLDFLTTPTYKYHCRDFAPYLGLHGDSAKICTPEYVMKYLDDEIGSKPLTYKTLGKDKRGQSKWFTHRTYWLSKIKPHMGADSDYITFVINPDIKEEVRALRKGTENFLTLNQNVIASLWKSSYSPRIYFMCKDYANDNAIKNGRNTFYKTYEELLEQWQITDKSYHQGKDKRRDFNRRIIGIEYKDDPKKSGTKSWQYAVSKVKYKKWARDKDGSMNKNREVLQEEVYRSSPLLQVNSDSNIHVKAVPKKKGKQYHGIEFTVTLKGRGIDMETITRENNVTTNHFIQDGSYTMRDPDLTFLSFKKVAEIAAQVYADEIDTRNDVKWWVSEYKRGEKSAAWVKFLTKDFKVEQIYWDSQEVAKRDYQPQLEINLEL